MTPLDRRVTSFAWSPDGTKIAYTLETPAAEGLRMRSDIWVMDLATSRSWRLTSDGLSSDPAWSPIGNEIAFVRRSEDYRDSRIYLISPSGEDVRALTDPGAVWSPSWSPDGSEVASVGYGTVSRDLESCQLVVTSVRTKVTREILGYEALERCPQSPAWRPSGSSS